MTKNTRIGVVGSVLWLIVAFLIANENKTYANDPIFITFLIIGITPVVSYWGWKFVKAAND